MRLKPGDIGVSFTRDIFAPAEIGVYCQHVCHPENSRFSVILLHDLAQGHKPNIWEYEPWNKFDIGDSSRKILE